MNEHMARISRIACRLVPLENSHDRTSFNTSEPNNAETHVSS
jgi:hypothetical protein